MEEITMQRIADEAGVSRMAVSLALRGSPKISEETTKRIRAIAKRLGYKPNPLVSALMRQLVKIPRTRTPKGEYAQRRVNAALRALMEAQEVLQHGTLDAAIKEVRKVAVAMNRRKK